MANEDPFLRNRRFTFGFLNTAQDGADIPEIDARVCYGLDADKLALGTLQSSNYSLAGSGPLVLDEASVLNSNFRVDSGNIEYWDGSGWVDIDDYLTAPDAPSAVLADEGASIDLLEDNYIGFTPSNVETAETASATKLTINPSVYETPNQSYTVRIRIRDSGANFQRWVTNYESTWSNTYPCDGAFHNVIYSVSVSVPASLGASLSDGDEITFNVSEDMLEDGTYFYVLSEVTNNNAKDIESLYSEVSKVTLANENYLGELTQYNKPKITVDRDATNKKWLYRKGPNDDVWVRMYIIDEGVGSVDIIDSKSISSLIDTKTISTLNPESTSSLLDASGATNWAYVFEKDNRLWAVPSERKDLVFFSEPLSWWRWTRTNSIGFDGNFIGYTELRDIGSVELKNTAVFQTTSGLYNVYGNGTEDSPYLRVAHEKSFNSTSGGSVKANNKIYLISDGATYDDGEWGRKLYEYDMRTLTELSAKVRNTLPFLNNSVGINYINQIGGDKLLIVPYYGPKLVYHIKLGGFIETDATTEEDGDWSWKSGIFHPMYSFSTKIKNVDKYSMVYDGAINITWNIDGVETVHSYNSTGRTLSMPEPRMPGQWGREMSFQIDGIDGAILYDFYFIADK